MQRCYVIFRAFTLGQGVLETFVPKDIASYLGPSPLAKVYWKPLCLKMLLRYIQCLRPWPKCILGSFVPKDDDYIIFEALALGQSVSLDPLCLEMMSYYI